MEQKTLLALVFGLIMAYRIPLQFNVSVLLVVGALKDSFLNLVVNLLKYVVAAA